MVCKSCQGCTGEPADCGLATVSPQGMVNCLLGGECEHMARVLTSNTADGSDADSKEVG